MRASTLLLILAAAAACTTGEGREDHGLATLAAVACQRARECGCELPRLRDTSGDTCDAAVLESWWVLEDPSSYLQNASVTFSTACLERAIEIVRDADCDADFSTFWVEIPCPLYHATRNVGDLCEPVAPAISPCLPGLACVDGRCEPSHVTGTGTSLPGANEPCSDFLECAPSAWCDFNDPDGPMCRALRQVGEACTGHRQCVTEYCPAGACDERPGDGEPCGANGICGDGLVCDVDTCRHLPSCLPPGLD